MRKWIIIGIILAVLVIGYFIWKRSKTQKALEEERSMFGGRTAAELTEEMRNAWKAKWIEAKVNWILGGGDGENAKQAIIAEALKQGDLTPIDELAQKHAVIGWAKDNPKANDTQWGKVWLWTYVKNTLNLNPNGANEQSIMKTI